MATVMAMCVTGCGGGGGGGDGDGNGDPFGDGTGGGSPDAPGGTSPAGSKRVFVTSTTYTGDLATAAGTPIDAQNAGVMSANKLCQTAASAAALGGIWKAILHQPGSGLDALADVGPWYRLDGTLVFNNRAQLRTTPLAPISIDELGHQQLGLGYVWTGLHAGGAPVPGCMYGSYAIWTFGNSAQNGVVGMMIATDSRWLYDSAVPCNTPNHLYCIEQ